MQSLCIKYGCLIQRPVARVLSYVLDLLAFLEETGMAIGHSQDEDTGRHLKADDRM